MDPLAAFGDGLVRKADDSEFGIAGRHLALNLDTARLKAEVSNSLDGRHHHMLARPGLSLTISAKQRESCRR